MSETTLVKNPTPKQQFLADSKGVTAHNNIMQMPQIQASLNMATLEYQRRLFMEVKDGNAAAAAALKVSGALEFVDVLIKLGTAPTAPEQPRILGLDHRA